MYLDVLQKFSVLDGIYCHKCLILFLQILINKLQK